MAVATQSVPGALRTNELTGVARAATGARARARSAPRWITPVVLVVADALALAISVALVGGGSAFVVAYPALALGCLSIAGAHRDRMTLRSLEAVPWTLGKLAIPLFVLAPIELLTGTNPTALLEVAVIAAALVIPARSLANATIRVARVRFGLLEPAVILGAGEVGAELARAFRDHPEYGVVPIGFLDCVPGHLPYPVLGDMDQLDQLLADYAVRRVIVAFGPARESELVGVLRTAVTYDVDVHIVPRFFDCGVSPEGPDTDDVRGIPLYRVRRGALRAPAWYLKRVVDVVFSSAVLLVSAPLLLVAAIGVKLSSPGPVLFHQRRVGQGGREIKVSKFRSLPVNPDGDQQWSVDADPRLTRFGRLLRRTSFDELPQLWSVLKGDMSLVGPRPERPFFVRRFNDDVYGYRDRHRLPVGLTGWAQVNGLRGDTSIEERARYDNQYIEHWSLWRDLSVLLRTVVEVMRGGDGRRGETSDEETGEPPRQGVELVRSPAVAARRPAHRVSDVVGPRAAEQGGR